MCFTRNPSTGKKEFYGEFLMNAQGEDVVAGIRTPIPLAQMKKNNPATYDQLEQIRQTLENHYKDMQDIEFTIEQRQALHAADPQRQAHRPGRRPRSPWTWSRKA